MSLPRKRKLTCGGKTGFWGPSESFWGFPVISQVQNVNLQIILLSVLDHWTLMYKMMMIVDKPGWSILKETRAYSCTVEPSLVEDIVFNPNCLSCTLCCYSKDPKPTITIIDDLYSPITLLNRVPCAFRVCISLLGFMHHICMHAILIWCWLLRLKK